MIAHLLLATLAIGPNLGLGLSLTKGGNLNKNYLDISWGCNTDRVKKGGPVTYSRSVNWAVACADALAIPASSNAPMAGRYGQYSGRSLGVRLLYTNDQTNANWTKNNVTAATGYTSPTGSSTANLLTATAGAGVHTVSQAVGGSTGFHGMSVKAGTATYAAMSCNGNADYSIWDLSTCSMTYQTTNTNTANTSYWENAAHTWCRISYAKDQSTNDVCHFGIANCSGSGCNSFAAAGTETIYVYNLYAQQLAEFNAYIATTSSYGTTPLSSFTAPFTGDTSNACLTATITFPFAQYNSDILYVGDSAQTNMMAIDTGGLGNLTTQYRHVMNSVSQVLNSATQSASAYGFAHPRTIALCWNQSTKLQQLFLDGVQTSRTYSASAAYTITQFLRSYAAGGVYVQNVKVCPNLGAPCK